MADPKEEIELLLNFLLPTAEDRLSTEGQFHPYAAMLDADGEVKSVTAPLGELPDVADLLIALHEELREQAAEGAIRASGIAADVTLTDPESGDVTDAIQIELDHAETEAVDIYAPYESGGERIKFGELVAAPGREPVFTTST
jgi:hypothetical protein